MKNFVCLLTGVCTHTHTQLLCLYHYITVSITLNRKKTEWLVVKETAHSVSTRIG